MDSVEIIAAILGLLSVILTIWEHVWTWPIGAAMYVLYFFTFLGARLYADAALQAIGFVLQFYGWYEWIHGGKNQGSLAISRLAPGAFVASLVLGAAGTLVVGSLLIRYTDQALAYWDSGIAVFSLIAQYLLAHKRLETWFIWIAIDVVAVGVFWERGLTVTAALYFVFFFLASAGLRTWLRAWQANQSPVVAAQPADVLS